VDSELLHTSRELLHTSLQSCCILLESCCILLEIRFFQKTLPRPPSHPSRTRTHIHTHGLHGLARTECTHLQSAHTFNTPVYVLAHTIEYTHVPGRSHLCKRIQYTHLQARAPFLHARAHAHTVITRPGTHIHIPYTRFYLHTPAVHAFIPTCPFATPHGPLAHRLSLSLTFGAQHRTHMAHAHGTVAHAHARGKRT